VPLVKKSDHQPIHSVATGEKSNREGNLSEILGSDIGAHDCVNSYTVIILYVLYAFDMFHTLSSGDSLRDIRNVYMYVRTYVCMYYVCMKIAVRIP